MPAEKIFEERKRDVLRMIVESYMVTARPVSSMAIASRFDLSAATIRHVMAELEESDHITHPHTSAGRIPTDKGYRYYVDDLMEVSTISQEKRDFIAQKYGHEDEYEKVLAKASALVSRLCHYPGMVSIPKLAKKNFIKEIRFIPLDQKRVLITLISNAQMVESKIVFLEREVSNSNLERLANYLGEKLRKDRIEERILKELERDLGSELVHQAETLMETAFTEKKEVFLEGANRLLEQPEFRDTERLKGVLRVFETKLLQLLELHRQEKGVNVSIGQENPWQDIQSCSLVTTAYRIKDKPVGAIGVIGPTRMKYSLVIPMVEVMGKVLEEVLARFSGEED